MKPMGRSLFDPDCRVFMDWCSFTSLLSMTPAGWKQELVVISVRFLCNAMTIKAHPAPTASNTENQRDQVPRLILFKISPPCSENSLYYRYILSLRQGFSCLMNHGIIPGAVKLPFR
jgi:hypothetical protein